MLPRKNVMGFIALVLILVVTGCQSAMTEDAGKNAVDANREPQSINLNKTVILNGIEKEPVYPYSVCLIDEINIYNQDFSSKIMSIKGGCAGIKAQAIEKISFFKNNRTAYHIIINGKEGYVLDSLVSESGICQLNEECQHILNRLNIGKTSSEEWIFLPKTPICYENRCVECLETRDCDGSLKCDMATHQCVDCLSDSDCPTSAYYEDRKFCDSDIHECVECYTNRDCTKEDRPLCQISGFGSQSNKCIECLDNYDCPETEYCTYEGKCADRS